MKGPDFVRLGGDVRDAIFICYLFFRRVITFLSIILTISYLRLSYHVRKIVFLSDFWNSQH